MPLGLPLPLRCEGLRWEADAAGAASADAGEAARVPGLDSVAESSSRKLLNTAVGTQFANAGDPNLGKMSRVLFLRLNGESCTGNS